MQLECISAQLRFFQEYLLSSSAGALSFDFCSSSLIPGCRHQPEQIQLLIPDQFALAKALCHEEILRTLPPT